MVKNWLYYQFRNNPTSDFLIEGNKIFTFEKFYFSVSDIAKSLHFNGLERNQKVVIVLEDSISLLQCFFSCQQLGAIPVIIDSKKSSIDLKNIIDFLSPDLVITTWKNKITGKDVLFFEEIMSVQSICKSIEVIEQYNDDHLSCILCTSGTTGKIKLVKLSYMNLYSSFISWNHEIEFKSIDRYACCIPLHHIGGISIIVRSTIVGFSVDLCLPFNSDKVRDIIDKSISIISLVPTMLDKILDGSKINSKILKAIIVGGDAMPDTLLDKSLKLNLPIYKTYGMTETSSGISGFFVSSNLNKKHTSGRPFKNVSIKLLNNTFLVNGPMVMQGYVGRLTSNNLTNSFHSNDIGKIDADGFVIVLGRKDRTILSGGEKINLIEVESALLCHPKVNGAKAKGIKDSKWGNRLVVAIDLDEKISLDELNFWCKNYLNNYSIPKNFILGVDSFEDNGNILKDKDWEKILNQGKLIR